MFQVHALIAGTQKGGTSALAHFLGQHPDLCLPDRKEAHFFDDHPGSPYRETLSPEAIARHYQSYFSTYEGQRVVIDATPIYMYFPQVAERVYRYNPRMKWILLIRDPVERAFSHYRMEFDRGFEHLPLWRALLAEPWRLRRDRSCFQEAGRRYSYVDRGKYAGQILRILRFFPKEQVCLIGSRELWEAHEETLRRIYAFLEVPVPEPLPSRARIFASTRKERHPWLRFLLQLYYLPERVRMRSLAHQLGLEKPLF